MNHPKRKIEPIVRLLPATPETFEMLEDEMLLYSLSLDSDSRMRELIELRKMGHPGPLPSIKAYSGWRKLTDPDPFDP